MLNYKYIKCGYSQLFESTFFLENVFFYKSDVPHVCYHNVVVYATYLCFFSAVPFTFQLRIVIKKKLKSRQSNIFLAPSPPKKMCSTIHSPYKLIMFE